MISEAEEDLKKLPGSFFQDLFETFCIFTYGSTKGGAIGYE